MHILITEEQLKKLIKEELGVSEKVIAASNELFRMLMEKISEGFKNGQKEITMSQFSNSFIFMWGDIKISVHFDVFNYRNNEFYEYSNVEATASSAWVSKKLLDSLLVRMYFSLGYREVRQVLTARSLWPPM